MYLDGGLLDGCRRQVKMIASVEAVVMVLLATSVSASCRKCTTKGDVRLVGWDDTGRVEMCYDKIWGSLFSTDWNENNARVVCGQLGFSSLRAKTKSRACSKKSPEPHRVHLSKMVCSGNETSLAGCSMTALTTPPSGDDESDRFAQVQCFLCGPCEKQGFNKCCECCRTATCWCDVYCHRNRDCCEDVDLFCPSKVAENHLSTPHTTSVVVTASSSPLITSTVELSLGVSIAIAAAVTILLCLLLVMIVIGIASWFNHYRKKRMKLEELTRPCHTYPSSEPDYCTMKPPEERSELLKEKPID